MVLLSFNSGGSGLPVAIAVTAHPVKEVTGAVVPPEWQEVARTVPCRDGRADWRAQYILIL